MFCGHHLFSANTHVFLPTWPQCFYSQSFELQIPSFSELVRAHAPLILRTWNFLMIDLKTKYSSLKLATSVPSWRSCLVGHCLCRTYLHFKSGWGRCHGFKFSSSFLCCLLFLPVCYCALVNSGIWGFPQNVSGLFMFSKSTRKPLGESGCALGRA